MNKYRVREVASRFWDLAGQHGPYPRDVASCIPLALPVSLVFLEQLTVAQVVEWVSRFHPTYSLPCSHRRLHGCLVAFGGQGVIFCDRLDSDIDQRFTLAHEVAHMMLDYLIPRDLAVKVCGPRVTEALDGFRPLSVEERVHAVISRQYIGVHTHLLERSQAVSVREDQADQLALELLAPRERVREALKGADLGSSDAKGFVTQLLVGEFGLPLQVAQAYAHEFVLAPRRTRVREWLGF